MSRKLTAVNPAIYVLTFTAFVMLSSEFIVAGLLPEIAADLHISLGDAGWMITAFAVGMGVSAPFLAALSHRFSKRQMLLGACVALLLGNFTNAVCHWLPVLLIGRAVAAVGVAMFWVNAPTAAELMSDGWNAPKGVASVLLGISIASVVGVPVGKLLSHHFGWQAAMWFMSLMSVAALVMVHCFVHPRVETHTPERFLAKVARLRNPGLLATFLTCALLFAGIGAMFNYLSAFLSLHAHFSSSDVTLLLCVYGLADIGGNLLWSHLLPTGLDRLFNRVLISLAAGMLALSVLGRVDVLVPLLVVIIAAGHAGVSLLQQMTLLKRGKGAIELVSAVNLSMCNVGIAFGTTVGGYASDHWGVGTVGFIAAPMILLALGVRTALARWEGKAEHRLAALTKTDDNLPIRTHLDDTRHPDYVRT